MTRLVKIKKINRDRRKISGKRSKIFKFNILCCGLLLVFVAAYLVVLNSTTVKGYELARLERQLSGLKKENKNLTLQLSDKQSMESIRKRVEQLSMVETGRFSFVSMQSSAMAKR
jgi:cell division protein FtsL